MTTPRIIPLHPDRTVHRRIAVACAGVGKTVQLDLSSTNGIVAACPNCGWYVQTKKLRAAEVV